MRIVDLPHVQGDLASAMSHIRSWLDTRDMSLSLFHLESGRYRLEFAVETDAIAFADAFGGRIIEDGAEIPQHILPLAEPGSCASAPPPAKRVIRLSRRTRRPPARAARSRRAACG